MQLHLYMLGLGGVIEGFYEPNEVVGWVKEHVRKGSARISVVSNSGMKAC